MRYATIAAAVAMLAATSVEAAPPAEEICSKPQELHRVLVFRHGERIIGSITGPMLSRIQLYASAAGTWTLVRTDAKQSCILEAGRNWDLPTIELGTSA